jgi:RNA polymerase sigma-70 factor (ECF subfamily)
MAGRAGLWVLQSWAKPSVAQCYGGAVEPRSSDVTLLLARAAGGDRQAASALVPLIYRELHRIAARHMNRERPDHTLQATALVHEAYIRLLEQRRTNWKNRAHFFGVAAQIMRRILVDHARGNLRKKRGGDRQKIALDTVLTISMAKSSELLAIDVALGRLGQRDPRQSQIVELKFFGGLTTEETAEVLNISPRTVEREWALARAWLYMQLQEGDGYRN